MRGFYNLPGGECQIDFLVELATENTEHTENFKFQITISKPQINSKGQIPKAV
jgi:hypothetical protein